MDGICVSVRDDAPDIGMYRTNKTHGRVVAVEWEWEPSQPCFSDAAGNTPPGVAWLLGMGEIVGMVHARQLPCVFFCLQRKPLGSK